MENALPAGSLLAPDVLSALALRANLLRQDVIEMLAAAGSGHPGGALGMADIFAVLYFGGVVKYRPHQPNWAERDRVVLSNGHICPILYAALAEADYFPKSWLKTLRQLDSPLQGHPSPVHTPGVETASGPLGQGLSQAIGMAEGLKLRGSGARVFCLTSDGEHDEGQTWEAIMYAGHRSLPNLTVIVDRNRIQISGTTEDVDPLDSLADKYRAFHWQVQEINGNCLDEVIAALAPSSRAQSRDLSQQTSPRVIIAHTTPGKGVSFMENKYEWHGKAPNAEQAKQALAELRAEATMMGPAAKKHAGHRLDIICKHFI